MSRYASVIATLGAFALVAAACGGSSVLTTSTAASATTSTSAPATSTTTAATTTSTAAPSTTTTSLPPPPPSTTTTTLAAMEIVTVPVDVTDPDLPYEFHLEIPELRNHPVPAVGDAINAQLRAGIEEMAASVADFATEIGDAEGKSTLDVQYSVTYFSDQLLSVGIDYFSYTSGAAHPASFVESAIFDIPSGTQLGLEDLLDPATAPAALANRIVTEIADTYYDGSAMEVASWVATQEELLALAWVWVGDDSIGFAFDQYAVGPGVLGPVHVELAYADIAPMLDVAGPLGSIPGAVNAAAADPAGLLSLRRDGLGLATFGEDPDTAVGLLGGVIGPPVTDSGWVDEPCIAGLVRTVTWTGLSAQFTAGPTQWSDGGAHFVSYSYFYPGGGDPLGLNTPEGRALGDSVAAMVGTYTPHIEINGVDTIYGPVFISGHPGAYELLVGRIVWTDGARPYWGNLGGVADGDVALSFNSGTDVCAGLV